MVNWSSPRSSAVGMLKAIFIQVKAACDDDDCGKVEEVL
jgi:hypothetical protein